MQKLKTRLFSYVPSERKQSCRLWITYYSLYSGMFGTNAKKWMTDNRVRLSCVLNLVLVFVRVMPGGKSPLVIPHCRLWSYLSMAPTSRLSPPNPGPSPVASDNIKLLTLSSLPHISSPPANREHVNVWHSSTCSMLIHLWPSWLKMNIGGMVNTGMPQAASLLTTSAQDHVNDYSPDSK